LKREIGWSGLGSVSIRCFGGKDALLPAGVMPFWDKEVRRAFGRWPKASSTVEADVGADWLGLI
jgi:hypothetical protein